MITVIRSFSTRILQNLFEGASKFHVEDGIDDGVEEAVHVAEPDEEREKHHVDVADAVVLEEVVAYANRIDDVDGEERNPTEQKHTW